MPFRFGRSLVVDEVTSSSSFFRVTGFYLHDVVLDALGHAAEDADLEIGTIALHLAGAAEEGDVGDTRPYSVQLHLHGSFSEGLGSVSSHSHEASKVGCDIEIVPEHEKKKYIIMYQTFLKDQNRRGKTDQFPSKNKNKNHKN